MGEALFLLENRKAEYHMGFRDLSARILKCISKEQDVRMWIHLAQDRTQCWTPVNMVINFRVA
jgi:hypothetical protein